MAVEVQRALVPSFVCLQPQAEADDGPWRGSVLAFVAIKRNDPLDTLPACVDNFGTDSGTAFGTWIVLHFGQNGGNWKITCALVATPARRGLVAAAARAR